MQKHMTPKDLQKASVPRRCCAAGRTQMNTWKKTAVVLGLALAGWLIALFHLLLAAGTIPESARPCTQGVPCTDEQIVWFGFVTVPLLSLLSFSIVNALLILTHLKDSK